MLFFVQHCYRVIGIDRRGHGRSSQLSDGHDMDHYAADAAAHADTGNTGPDIFCGGRIHVNTPS
jgi:pimeloyl-ACP methyl ester carboxylesterase